MGWSYMHRDKGVSSREFYSQGFFAAGTGTVLDVASIGFRGEAYIAYATENGVMCVIVEQHWVPSDHYNFGYKVIDEDMGPYETRCPRRILELLSPVEALYEGEGQESARAWREACWKRISERAQKPSVSKGQKIVFASPIKFANGTSDDTFVFERGSTFRGRSGYGRYKISGWRDRDYQLA